MSENPLNILLITSDQQHWNTLGIDNPEIKTPNLDRLARQGMLFERAYTVNPTCTPTRASIITGLYPSQHGAYSLGTKLDEQVHTVGEDFTDAGYATALVGKAHFQPLKTTDEYPSLEAYPVLQDLDFWREFTGPFYGFDHVELARNHTNESHVGQHYALWMEEKGLENWRDYYLEPTGNMKHSGERWDLADSMHWKIPEEYHYDAWISERSCALLEDYADQDIPFFLWSSFFDPHPAYMVPEPWNTMYDTEKITVPSKVEGEHDANPPHFQMTQEENPDFSIYQEPDGNGCHGFGSHLHDREDLAKRIAVYYGMISLMDKHIGIILDKLEELGLADNTLVVFTTDHGHFYGHHGLTAKGAFHYEDMIKLPWIVSQPGKVPAGKRSEAFQSIVDLPVSFLSAAGLHVPRTMTGLDQTPVWYGESDSVRDHIICENRHQPTKMHCKTYVDKRYKITVYYDADYGELFDLQEDPGEVHNRWDDPNYAEVKSKMLLRFMQGELGKEPLPMPRIAGA